MNKKKLIVICFFCLTLIIAKNTAAQKAINDYSVQELSQKKAEALASGSKADAGVYDAALMLREEINVALKVEDYDKATGLQAQLKALKLQPPPSNKAKEIQEAINKAVASEDYEKAESLKKELDALKNPAKITPTTVKETKTSAPPPSSQTVITSTHPSNVSSSDPSSKLSKNDIYGNTTTYMGLDFSLFNFVSIKKNGEEQKNIKFISVWQDQFSKKIPEKKLAQWLGKSEFNSDRESSENLYTQNLNRQWIVASGRSLSENEIQAQLQTYKSSHHGLGLVFVPGSFDETNGQLSLYIVWFDLDTRTIVNMQNVSVKAGPSTMTARWLDGLVASTKKYIDQYYKKRQ